ncbi:MAG: peptidase [Pedobacter sp.]|nr:MAG: peptidase [Pedobacter sp.]
MKKSKTPKKELNKVSRWLHIYLSMFSFAIVFFFSFTGLTLNHPTWFGADKQIEKKFEGKLPEAWVIQADTNKINKLSIVEYFRDKHKIKAAVKEFRIEEYDLSISFKGPAYSADIFINRENATFEGSEIKMGMMALMNDLHKGRDAGEGWLWVIDVSAIFLILISLSGLILICYIKKKRFAGFLAAAVGLLIVGLIYYLWT